MVETEGRDGTIRRELTEARRLGSEGRGFESRCRHRIFSLGISVKYLYLFHLASIVQLLSVWGLIIDRNNLLYKWELYLLQNSAEPGVEPKKQKNN